MYQNCLLKFFYNIDSQVLIYLARPHYEDTTKSNPHGSSNYTLRFDVGVSVQKFSASTLQKTKRNVAEVEATVPELKNVVRVFGLLSSVSNLHSHGFDEKKIETHVVYGEHLLEAAHIHCVLVDLLLKKVTLDGLGIPWATLSIVGSLPNLRVLKLMFRACSGSTWEANDGKFQCAC
ncbi:hypothetical protein OROHE_019619 [Orobanche hederae]